MHVCMNASWGCTVNDRRTWQPVWNVVGFDIWRLVILSCTVVVLMECSRSSKVSFTTPWISEKTVIRERRQDVGLWVYPAPPQPGMGDGLWEEDDMQKTLSQPVSFLPIGTTVSESFMQWYRTVGAKCQSSQFHGVIHHSKHCRVLKALCRIKSSVFYKLVGDLQRCNIILYRSCLSMN